MAKGWSGANAESHKKAFMRKQGREYTPDNAYKEQGQKKDYEGEARTELKQPLRKRITNKIKDIFIESESDYITRRVREKKEKSAYNQGYERESVKQSYNKATRKAKKQKGGGFWGDVGGIFGGLADSGVKMNLKNESQFTGIDDYMWGQKGKTKTKKKKKKAKTGKKRGRKKEYVIINGVTYKRG